MTTDDVSLYHAALHHDNCTAGDMLDGVNTGSRIYDVACYGSGALDASDMVLINIKVSSVSVMGICHIFKNDATLTRIRGLNIYVHWNLNVRFELIQYDYYSRICAASDCVSSVYTTFLDLACEMNADYGHSLLLPITILQYSDIFDTVRSCWRYCRLLKMDTIFTVSHHLKLAVGSHELQQNPDEPYFILNQIDLDVGSTILHFTATNARPLRRMAF
jgi:hypothetical protein